MELKDTNTGKRMNSERNTLRFIMMNLIFKITTTVVSLLIATSIYSKMSDKDINSMINIAASDYSNNLPLNIDAATTLIQVYAGMERDMIYKYVLKLKSSGSSKEAKKVIKPYALQIHTNNYCSQPDLKIFRDEDVVFEHNYVDRENNFIFKVRVYPEDC